MVEIDASSPQTLDLRVTDEKQGVIISVGTSLLQHVRRALKALQVVVTPINFDSKYVGHYSQFMANPSTPSKRTSMVNNQNCELLAYRATCRSFDILAT